MQLLGVHSPPLLLHITAHPPVGLVQLLHKCTVGQVSPKGLPLLGLATVHPFVLDTPGVKLLLVPTLSRDEGGETHPTNVWRKAETILHMQTDQACLVQEVSGVASHPLMPLLLLTLMHAPPDVT